MKPALARTISLSSATSCFVIFQSLLLGVPQSHALEAVAQGGVGSGSAAAAQNLALETKVMQAKALGDANSIVIKTLQQELISLTGKISALENTVSATNTNSTSAPLLRTAMHFIDWAASTTGSFTCPEARQSAVSCRSYSIPSGQNSCNNFISADSRTCSYGGCTATSSGDTRYRTEVTCGWVESQR